MEVKESPFFVEFAGSVLGGVGSTPISINER